MPSRKGGWASRGAFDFRSPWMNPPDEGRPSFPGDVLEARLVLPSPEFLREYSRLCRERRNMFFDKIDRISDDVTKLGQSALLP
ncbi:hypothetical protein [Mesorhizobium sp. WSM3626]|uniref:hypothetical protein n=1 Tax=Mesorhizobium sp. WSM3626 TaxID=1040987 RepID=UPI0012EC1B54|nr:hypothetical protein [Mesorhizobium sp. WSM3626]